LTLGVKLVRLVRLCNLKICGTCVGLNPMFTVRAQKAWEDS
jgi:hypothetical protein